MNEFYLLYVPTHVKLLYKQSIDLIRHNRVRSKCNLLVHIVNVKKICTGKIFILKKSFIRRK